MNLTFISTTMDIIQRYGNIAVSILLVILAFKFSGLSKEVISLKQEDAAISAKVAENETQKQVVNDVLGKMKDIGDLNSQIVGQLKDVVQYNTNMVTEIAKMQEEQKVVKAEVATLSEMKDMVLTDHEITSKNEKDVKYVMNVIKQAVEKQNEDLEKAKLAKKEKEAAKTSDATLVVKPVVEPTPVKKTTWKFIKPWTWF